MSRNNILIVDDEPSITELLKVNLENAGYGVFIAYNGEQALRIIEAVIPELVILDIMLPGISGYDICSKLRLNDMTQLTPLIILSAKGKTEDKIAGLKMGADDYISKPFDIDELIERVNTLIGRTQRTLSANPLTHLPGNVSIVNAVYRKLNNKEKFAFMYIDIDNFKGYNDAYGFESGDKVIRFTADVIKNCVSQKDFIGHIGGDDFIVVCGIGDERKTAERIMISFDSKIKEYYNAEDRKRGYIISKNRKGDVEHFPLMTVSIGVVTNDKEGMNHYGKIVEVAAEMKKFAKMKKPSKSSVEYDRRKVS
ncbi:MAG: response regulator [Elusimicrobia bacterium]|nr:response regulator [Elusimicrobiota bacterium]